MQLVCLDSFDILPRVCLSARQKHACVLAPTKSPEFFQKRKPRPERSPCRAPVHRQRQQKAVRGEREPRRRGVGTCCFRFAAAEEGVTVRASERASEKERGGEKVEEGREREKRETPLCALVPASCAGRLSAGTIGVARGPLFIAPPLCPAFLCSRKQIFSYF